MIAIKGTYNMYLTSRSIKRTTRKTKNVCNKKGETAADITEIQKNRKRIQQLYGNKSNNLEEMDKFLETLNLWRLNQEEKHNLSKPITINETEFVI